MAKKIAYNKGKNISPVAFMFACPGQKEEKAGRVVAGATGKNLDLLLSVLAESENEKIRALFPSSDRYDYLITNSSDIIHYPALDNTSLPSKGEYSDDANLNRLYKELDHMNYVIAFGIQIQAPRGNAAPRFHHVAPPSLASLAQPDFRGHGRQPHRARRPRSYAQTHTRCSEASHRTA